MASRNKLSSGSDIWQYTKNIHKQAAPTKDLHVHQLQKKLYFLGEEWDNTVANKQR